MKFHRARDQRAALIRSLADSLVLNESIKTTLPKAKALARYTEKLVTKAKKGQESLHNRRQVMAGLNTIEAAHKLVDELAPQLSKRSSGFLRIQREDLRRGDSAQMAKVSFVDEFKALKPIKKQTKKAKTPAKHPKAKTDKADTTNQPAQVVPKDTAGKTAKSPAVKIRSKRVGIRGNR